MDIRFAKTRWHYDSYTDFWKLVELSGYPICYTDEMDLSANCTYITAPMNGEWNPFIDHYLQSSDNRNARLFLWNLERPGPQSIAEYRTGNQDLIDQGHFDGIIVSDREIARQTGFTYVPIGIHPDLGQPGPFSGKEFDVIHLMCPSFRRSLWFNSEWIPRSVVKGVSVAANGWGEDRHKRMQTSRYMANVHQDEHPYIEPLRFTLAAAYGLRIVTEPSADFYPYDECGGIIVTNGDVFSIVKAYNEVEYALGQDFRQRMIDQFTFIACIERYLI